MTYKENITAILECYFAGFKNEIIDSACNRILEQEPCVHMKDLSVDDINYFAEEMKKVRLQVLKQEPEHLVNESGDLVKDLVKDAISRQTVLDKIKEVCFSKKQEWVDFRVSQGSNGQRDFIIKFIEDLPSVQPKLKTDVLDKIRAEIDRQGKWLLQAGYTTYNVDIALDAIKSVVVESEE